MKTANEMYQYCLENNCCNGLKKKCFEAFLFNRKRVKK